MRGLTGRPLWVGPTALARGEEESAGQTNRRVKTRINTTNLSVSNTSLHAGAHRVTVAETGVMTLGRSTYTATTGAFQVTGDVTRSVADTLILGGPGSVVTLGLTPFQGVSIGNDTNANFPTGGSLVVNGDTYTVTASGGDIWGSSDGCYLAYLEFDAGKAIDISAYVGANGFVGGTNGWRKAGLMVRDSLDPGSRNAITLIAASDGNGINAQIRRDDNIGSVGGARDRHREFAYFMHNNIPEGPPYPIRAVTDGLYHYIRNLRPDALYIEKHLMGQHQWHAYWPSWVFETTFGRRTRRLVNRYMHRPPEQLYRLDTDPFEMTDLAADPAHAAAKKRLSAELDRWMKQQGDPGAAIDTQEQWRASKQGKHFGRGEG